MLEEIKSLGDVKRREELYYTEEEGEADFEMDVAEVDLNKTAQVTVIWWPMIVEVKLV